jgi:hypothetical protein
LRPKKKKIGYDTGTKKENKPNVYEGIQQQQTTNNKYNLTDFPVA